MEDRGNRRIELRRPAYTSNDRQAPAKDRTGKGHSAPNKLSQTNRRRGCHNECETLLPTDCDERQRLLAILLVVLSGRFSRFRSSLLGSNLRSKTSRVARGEDGEALGTFRCGSWGFPPFSLPFPSCCVWLPLSNDQSLSDFHLEGERRLSDPLTSHG